jgi:hypothetical protein
LIPLGRHAAAERAIVLLNATMKIAAVKPFAGFTKLQLINVGESMLSALST